MTEYKSHKCILLFYSFPLEFLIPLHLITENMHKKCRATVFYCPPHLDDYLTIKSIQEAKRRLFGTTAGIVAFYKTMDILPCTTIGDRPTRKSTKM